MRIGSLFSGAGGLDLAVEAVFGGYTVWQCENDPAAAKVLRSHWTDVPNLGDITAVDWAAVEPVDVLCGGFPCQDVSTAASHRRQGLRDGNRSGLWSHMAAAIDVLRPPFVVIENVKGLLSATAHRAMEPDDTDLGTLRAAGAVLGDLASLGFNAEWTVVPASAVGAPHKRERIFILAAAADTDNAGRSQQRWSCPTPPQHPATERGRGQSPRARLLPTPSASDGIGGGPNNPENRLAQGHQVQLIDLGLSDTAWDQYLPAIRHWENLTRPAPTPIEPYKRRLNAAFVEWMMGWPDGWVTKVPGEQLDLFGGTAWALTRVEQLTRCGNGVVPQQAEHALRRLLSATCEVAA
ncbi:DNA cytosine methyltransferase [Mycobacterium asiaticum]|uniref:DNA (cytosine-5-)-methyltransferase n=1 Tax=Mycobacterium asiaticum TaxID=1790 RepID=A0A1A3NN78_MYCAS|nr:DNA cytosine methyltransferase [Mycobacterium asiaticum]OBK22534.1 hypothetical protein A5635_21705 [Mycobacterium asiaticum]